MGMSAEQQAEGGCPCHPDLAAVGRSPDICPSALSTPRLSAEQDLTNAYLRGARGGCHNRTRAALPRSHFCSWFGPWLALSESRLVMLKSHRRGTGIKA